MTRLSVPRPEGLRGFGLGNEAIPMAKAWLAAGVVRARALDPLLLGNVHGLDRELPGAVRGATRIAAARARRGIEITEPMYASAGTFPYEDAVRVLVERDGIDRRQVLWHSGMWGGFLSVTSARPWLWERFAVPELVTSDAYLAVHVRLGDFGDNATVRRDTFNQRLPAGWYADAVDVVRRSGGDRLPVELHTDSPDHPGVAEIVRRTGATVFDPRGHPPARATVTRLAGARALVCSVSSMSMLAAYFSGRPYVWCADQLAEVDDTWSIWGARADQLRPGSPTRTHRDAGATGPPRGLAVPIVGASAVADRDWFDADRHPIENDLLYYGSVAVPR